MRLFSTTGSQSEFDLLKKKTLVLWCKQVRGADRYFEWQRQQLFQCQAHQKSPARMDQPVLYWTYMVFPQSSLHICLFAGIATNWTTAIFFVHFDNHIWLKLLEWSLYRRVDFSNAIEKRDLRAYVRAYYSSIIEIDAALSAKSTEESAIHVETSTNKSLTSARERMIMWKWKLLEKDHMLTRQEVAIFGRD